MPLTLRRTKGAPLTNDELDDNFVEARERPWGEPIKVAAPTTLTKGRRHHINTNSALVLLMPAGASNGDWLIVSDVKLKAGQNNITLDGNGALMPGGEATYVMDVSGETIAWVFDFEEGWVRG